MKVAVGLSGGVDSSVAAYLLKEQGHEVIGVTMLVWPDSKCCSGEAVADARKVAKYLGIEHHIYDLVPEFTQEIVSGFISEYSDGRTPNPCPTCNYRMKFHFLWNAIKEMHPDVDKISTGHYVSVGFDENTERYQLFKGKDTKKDQSYMLYKLNQEQLSRIMFPLGELTKKETREFAVKGGLDNVAGKADSMDLCFIGGNVKNFLKQMAPEKAVNGDIVNTSGKKLGTHEGIINYTIGQRKGIQVPSLEKLYVVALNSETNTVIVGTKDETYSPGLIATDVNWVSIPQPETPIYAQVKSRYLSNPEPAEIIPVENNNIKIVFQDKQSALTPGQSAVFYLDNMLLGGATISQVIT